MRCRLSDTIQVMSTYSGRQQRLVGIAPGGISDQQLVILKRPTGKTFWSLVEQNIAGTAWMLLSILNFRNLGLAQITEIKPLFRLDTRIAVDGGVTDETENFVGTVLLNGELKNFRILFEERSITFPFDKDRMGDDLFEKTNIGFHPTNPEFLKCAMHSARRIAKRQAPSRYFNQQ